MPDFVKTRFAGPGELDGESAAAEAAPSLAHTREMPDLPRTQSGGRAEQARA